MHYSNIVFSKFLEQPQLRTMLEVVVRILKENHISEVDLLFGWNWSVDLTPVKTNIDDVIAVIKKREDQNLGQLGSDDVPIIINQQGTRILFCHDGDIHLLYNKKNKLVASVISTWEAEQIIATCKRS